MDLSRKQVPGDRVTWTARGVVNETSDVVRGRCEVVFRDGMITSLRLGGGD
jgi:hypothetical protein